MFEKRPDIPIVILLAGLAIVTLFPFINTGFATGDDLEFMITALSGHSLSAAEVYATGAGRFYYYFTKPFYDLPYMLGGITFAKSINILFVFVNFTLLAFIAWQLTRDKWTGYFTFLLTIVFVTIKGANNPIVSFLWYFPVTFTFILFSIIFSLKFLKTKKLYFRNLAVAFYTIGLLFYETYLLYLPLLIFIFSSNSLWGNEYNFKEKLRKGFVINLPFLIVGIAYLLTYFLFRYYVSDSQYDGTQFATSFSLKKTIDTMLNLASGAYPAFYYFNGHSVYEGSSYLLENHRHNIVSLLMNAKAEWYFRAIVISVLSFYFVKRSNLKDWKKTIFLILFCLIFIYLPHLPLALTPKYTTNYFASNYVTTYFSYISISLLLALLFLFVNWVKNGILKKTLQIFVITCIAMGSLMCDYSNWHSTKDLQIPLNTFKSIDKFAEADVFNSVPENAFIFAPSLFIRTSKISWVYLHTWSDYLTAKTGKRVIISGKNEEFTRELNKPKSLVYYLNFGADRKSVDRYIAFAKVKNVSMADSVNTKIYSDSLTIFYYSTHKDFSLAFATNSHIDSLNVIKVNGEKFLTKDPFIKLRCRYKNLNEYFKPITICSKDIDLKSIIISNQLMEDEVDFEL
jgi:hypothetical protein